MATVVLPKKSAVQGREVSIQLLATRRLEDDVDALMGPVLYFRGMSAERCHLVATLVTTKHAHPGDLRVDDGGKTSPEILATHRDLVVWRYTFSIPAGQQETGIAYTIGPQTWTIYPPSHDHLRVAFTACNGSENDALALGDPRRNERWRHLAHEHAKSPFHLLIQGGDQLYADLLWQEVPYLAEWSHQKWRTRLQALFPPHVAEAVADFYFKRYCRLWAQSELAPLVASIPSVMMWDDHDVFDGWGSQPLALQQCPVHQGVWSVARKHFALFQLGALPDTLPQGFGHRGGEHFSWAFQVGHAGIVAPDLRSSRTQKQIMSAAIWQWLEQTLKAMHACQHLMLVSTVPVANVVLTPLERLLFWIPRQQPYQDDLRDQWQSYTHREEWQRLVKNFFWYRPSRPA